MTIYAKEVPAELTESPLWIGIFEDLPVIVISSDCKTESKPFDWESKHYELWLAVKAYFGDVCSEYKDLISGEYPSNYDSLRDIVKAYFAYYGIEPNADMISKIRKFAKEYNWETEDEIHVEVFKLFTGIDWKVTEIRGCAYGEWAEIMYIDGMLDVEEFEALYFNTGTEFIIHDEDTEVECADDISGYSVYTHLWREDDVKKWIAENFGHPGEDVVLYKFTGREVKTIFTYEIA